MPGEKLRWKVYILYTVLKKSWKQHTPPHQKKKKKKKKSCCRATQDTLGTTGEIWMNSLAKFSYGFLHMDIPVLADSQKLILISCVDTRWYLKDLPRAMTRDRWWEKAKGIHAIGPLADDKMLT